MDVKIDLASLVLMPIHRIKDKAPRYTSSQFTPAQVRFIINVLKRNSAGWLEVKTLCFDDNSGNWLVGIRRKDGKEVFPSQPLYDVFTSSIDFVLDWTQTSLITAKLIEELHAAGAEIEVDILRHLKSGYGEKMMRSSDLASLCARSIANPQLKSVAV